MLLQLQGGDPVGVGGNQIGRLDPDRERKLGAVHDGADSHRSLLAGHPAHSKVNALVASAQVRLPSQAGQTKPSGRRCWAR